MTAEQIHTLLMNRLNIFTNKVTSKANVDHAEQKKNRYSANVLDFTQYVSAADRKDEHTQHTTAKSTCKTACQYLGELVPGLLIDNYLGYLFSMLMLPRD